MGKVTVNYVLLIGKETQKSSSLVASNAIRDTLIDVNTTQLYYSVKMVTASNSKTKSSSNDFFANFVTHVTTST